MTECVCVYVCARMSLSDCFRPTASCENGSPESPIWRFYGLWLMLEVVRTREREKVFFDSFPVIKISPCQRKSWRFELCHMCLARGDLTRPSLTTKPELPSLLFFQNVPPLCYWQGRLRAGIRATSQWHPSPKIGFCTHDLLYLLLRLCNILMFWQECRQRLINEWNVFRISLDGSAMSNNWSKLILVP